MLLMSNRTLEAALERGRVAPPKKPAKRPGRPPKAKPKAYPEEIQTFIRNFLMECQENAIKAHEAAVAILSAAPTLPGAENQLAYWKHILRAIDWLLSYVNRRQRHLTNTNFVDP